MRVLKTEQFHDIREEAANVQASIADGVVRVATKGTTSESHADAVVERLSLPPRGFPRKVFGSGAVHSSTPLPLLSYESSRAAGPMSSGTSPEHEPHPAYDTACIVPTYRELPTRWPIEGDCRSPPHPPSAKRQVVPTNEKPRSLFFDNDPSAGSPTETLLRLLLPLDSQV